MNSRRLTTNALFLFCLLFINISQGADSIRLFGENQNRSKVVQSAFSYYPENAELRVQLVLENRQVKTGIYRDEKVISHLLTILSKETNELYCSYDGNRLLAIGEFSNRH